jgi:predicted DNA-binding transcriptional regulator YafY
MPETKKPLARYRIINACLLSKNKEYWSLTELKRKLEDYDIFVSTRTLLADIEFLRNDTRVNYAAPIGYSAANRGYHYTNSRYSINGIDLSDEELDMLIMARKLLKPFEGIDGFQNFQSIVDRIVRQVNANVLSYKDYSVPEIENTSTISDQTIELVNHFLRAIREKVTVKVFLKESACDEERKIFFHPYSLCVNKQHWYITGLRDSDNLLVFFELDSIAYILFSNKVFIPFQYELNMARDPGSSHGQHHQQSSAAK